MGKRTGKEKMTILNIKKGKGAGKSTAKTTGKKEQKRITIFEIEVSVFQNSYTISKVQLNMMEILLFD